MKRRTFVKSLASLPIGYWLSPGLVWAGKATSRATSYTLKAQQTQWRIFSQAEPPTAIWSFEERRFGKPIYAKQHEALRVKVSNALTQGLGVHWHGIRVPNQMDGVPGLTQDPISAKGGTFEYHFTSPDAGTYWYHSHANSAEQVERGLLGPLIIQETTPYPVDEELVLLIKDWKLKKNLQVHQNFFNRHEAAHDGRWGTVTTVNGRHRPSYSYKTHSRLRLRLINGSNARVLSLDLAAFERAVLIAVDGHPVAPQKYQPFYLAPGMRAEVVVDLHAPNRAYPIVDAATRNRNQLAALYTTAQKIRRKPLASSPPPLPANPLPSPKLSQATTIDLSLEGGAMSMDLRRGMMGMRHGMRSGLFWTINGKSMREARLDHSPILRLKKNKSYRFNIKNATRFPHPMHLHGHTFKVLKKKPYWSDTLFLLPGEKLSVAFVADNPGQWMFHCHILEHQSSGMMGVVEVS